MSKYIQNAQNQKSNLINQILDLLPDEEKCTVQQARNTWWFNIRKTGGLRLTSRGYEIFKDILKFETWVVDISQNDNKLNQRILLELDKTLSWPYYVETKKKKIHFFSSREATLATLYGDVHTWLSKSV